MHEFPHSQNFDSDLREIIEMYFTLKDLPDKWDAFENLVNGEVQDLKNFVNNYFNNLDVQNEINNKLDAMATDGTLTNLISPLFNEFQQSVNILSARMNAFTSLPEGATSGDAELADAHVDYNGHTHANVGEHIRNITENLNTEKLGYKGFIDAQVDCNNLVDVGVYNITNNAVIESSNYPSNVGGILTVIKRSNYEFPMIQTLIDNGNKFYTRYKTETEWSEWSKYANKTDVDNVNYKCLSFREYIDEPRDMDNITNIGIYQIMNAVVSECANYPSKYSGFLTVTTNSQESIAYQHLIDSSGNLYIRYKTGNGWIEWKKYSIEDEIERHTDGIGALLDVAETYFDVAYDVNDQLLYDSKHGLFNSQVTDDFGIKAIVCSQFTQACIAGITYKNSRYVGNDNLALPWGFVSDGSGVYAYTDWNAYNDYMTACEQAKYFEGQGKLNTFDVNRNALKAGDLVFYKGDVDEDIYYKKIVHIAICLAADKNRYTIIESNDNYARMVDGKEAGTLVSTFRYTTKSPDYFVHSPIMAEYINKKIGEKKLNRNASYTSTSAFIGEFVFEEYLPRGFYTLQFDDLGDSLGYISVNYKKGEELISKNYNAIKNANINSIIFYAELPIASIYIRVSNGTKYNCSWSKLYKGYHN